MFCFDSVQPSCYFCGMGVIDEIISHHCLVFDSDLLYFLTFVCFWNIGTLFCGSGYVRESYGLLEVNNFLSFPGYESLISKLDLGPSHCFLL